MATYNFETKTYNGVSIIVNTVDGYVNASQMCSSNNKKWRNYNKSKSWIQVKTAFERRFSEGAQKWTPSYYLDKVAPKWQGEYVHPKLVHFVAEYCSVDYAFDVAEIMDSINDKVHEELKKQELPDTVDNAKPIFKEVAKTIAPNIQINNSSTWGYRDSPYELDSWEQDDLRSTINEYKNIKERLTKAEEKINEWSGFVEKYFPDFQK